MHTDPMPGLSDRLNGIRAAMHQWDAQRSSPEWTGEALKIRVAQVIEPYLGEEGARTVLLKVEDNGCNLLSTLEGVLADFLGKRAAAELVNQVVDEALAGRHL
jgi:hypothetical protein